MRLGEPASRVMSLGGRFGFDDDGETPNTHVAVLDYQPTPIYCEVRGLPEKKGSKVLDSFLNTRLLARVPQDQLPSRSAYEFFVRLDTQGQPVWSKDITGRGAVFSHPGRCYRSGIMCNAALKRY